MSALVLAFALLLLVAPQISEACPVCFSARDENREAFLTTAIFMTALPLFMIGGTVAFFWRRAQRLESEREASPEPAPGLADLQA